MRKVSHEGRITRSEKALREMGFLPKEVHFQTAANDNLDRYSISDNSQIDNGDMEAMYRETYAKENNKDEDVQSYASKSVSSIDQSWKSDNDGDDESQAGEEEPTTTSSQYERRDTLLPLEQKVPKSALKFRLERRKSIDPLPTAMIEKKSTIPVQIESRSTAMSMASMVSEKITMADAAESVVDVNDRSARRSYIFNDYRVEETYAGPGLNQ